MSSRNISERSCCIALGRLTADEKTFIPESEFAKVFLSARIYVADLSGVIGLAIYTRSILPLMF